MLIHYERISMDTDGMREREYALHLLVTEETENEREKTKEAQRRHGSKKEDLKHGAKNHSSVLRSIV